MEHHHPVNAPSNQFRMAPIIGVVLVFIGLAVAGILWNFSRVSTSLVEATTIEDASRSTAILQEFRSLYTSEVVNRLESHDITITHAYTTTDRAIPLPATLTILLGQKVSDSDIGGGVSLYSDYPFPWRVDGGIQDSFQRDALTALRQNPTQPFFRFETINGRTNLRYATADLMRPGCVSCHNSHPDSPKRDWKVGDVRGVLEIIRPLDRVTVQVRDSLWQTFFLIMGGALVGLTLLIAMLRRLTSTTHQLQIAKETAEAAHGQLEAALAEQIHAESERLKMQESLIDLQSAMVEELSTPLMPISDQTVVMPLIGRMNEERAQQVMIALLNGITRTQATVAIIDLTGLTVMDQSAISLLVQSIQAVRLLGAKIVLTGMQPAMANELVQQDISMDKVITYQTLEMGIAYASGLANTST